VSPVRKHIRRPESDILQGDISKMNSPSFDEETRMGEDVESWLLGMRKYL
jgi:hypothetical protein